MASLSPIFILGPTGSGKSAVAVALAELLGNAEIVSADAYQVYRGMEILTAAPGADELARVPHHLVSCLDPTENNDAATHARAAQKCIADIQARGKRPIITGGSGLYVKFISHGISPAPPSDAGLRAELSALPLPELVARLQAVDPQGAASTDLQNARYVIRNLEIVLLGGKPLAYWRQNWQTEPAGPGFSIVRDIMDLDTRIALRSRLMIRDGAIAELIALGDLSRLSATAAKTLGLSHIATYLATSGDPAIKARVSPCLLPSREDQPPLSTKRELAAAIALATRQYAKRQRTWLRREAWLTPLQVTQDMSPAHTATELAHQLTTSYQERAADHP